MGQPAASLGVPSSYPRAACARPQSAIAARELGFKVTLLADCCATLDPQLEKIALTYLERVVGARVERDRETVVGGSTR